MTAVLEQQSDGALETKGAAARCLPQVPQSSRARSAEARARPGIAFVWEMFSPHHVDRCAACAQAFAGRFDVYGIEIATFDAHYEWREGQEGAGFTKVTLFPGRLRQTIGNVPCAAAIVAQVLRLGVRYVFLCNYESPAILISAIILRLLGRRLVVMQDSKFDDKQRHVLKELAKSFAYAPYHAALAAGFRTQSYLRFLGFRDDRVFVGYDTVSLARMRELARAAPAPGGTPWRERHFAVVARFIPKKNLSLAIDAYAAYCAAQRSAGMQLRELHLCGSGELEGELKAQAQRLGLGGVRFRGYLDEEGVARTLASTLALILPSIEDQHGLVVNEALALGVPVLVSENCGARDLLMRTGVNGYVFEPDNAEGLAYFMGLLDRDEALWRRLSQGTERFAAAAGSGRFVVAVEQAVAALS